jgi:hypothetical protein
VLLSKETQELVGFDDHEHAKEVMGHLEVAHTETCAEKSLVRLFFTDKQHREAAIRWIQKTRRDAETLRQSSAVSSGNSGVACRELVNVVQEEEEEFFATDTKTVSSQELVCVAQDDEEECKEYETDADDSVLSGDNNDDDGSCIEASVGIASPPRESLRVPLAVAGKKQRRAGVVRGDGGAQRCTLVDRPASSKPGDGTNHISVNKRGSIVLMTAAKLAVERQDAGGLDDILQHTGLFKTADTGSSVGRSMSAAGEMALRWHDDVRSPKDNHFFTKTPRGVMQGKFTCRGIFRNTWFAIKQHHDLLSIFFSRKPQASRVGYLAVMLLTHLWIECVFYSLRFGSDNRIALDKLYKFRPVDYIISTLAASLTSLIFSKIMRTMIKTRLARRQAEETHEKISVEATRPQAILSEKFRVRCESVRGTGGDNRPQSTRQTDGEAGGRFLNLKNHHHHHRRRSSTGIAGIELTGISGPAAHRGKNKNMQSKLSPFRLCHARLFRVAECFVIICEELDEVAERAGETKPLRRPSKAADIEAGIKGATTTTQYCLYLQHDSVIIKPPSKPYHFPSTAAETKGGSTGITEETTADAAFGVVIEGVTWWFHGPQAGYAVPTLLSWEWQSAIGRALLDDFTDVDEARLRLEQARGRRRIGRRLLHPTCSDRFLMCCIRCNSRRVLRQHARAAEKEELGWGQSVARAGVTGQKTRAEMVAEIHARAKVDLSVTTLKCFVHQSDVRVTALP